MLFDKKFWIGLSERATKTFCQALLVAGIGNGTGLVDFDWKQALGVALMLALASVLTSVSNAVPGPATPIEGNPPADNLRGM